MKRIHQDDKKMFEKFIDYVRLKRSKPTSWKLEYYTRLTAEHYGIKSDTTNGRLANKIAARLEAK